MSFPFHLYLALPPCARQFFPVSNSPGPFLLYNELQINCVVKKWEPHKKGENGLAG